MTRFIWNVGDQRYLFHYTRVEDAEGLFDTGIAVVGTGSNYGIGFYATDMQPDAYELDEIDVELFPGWQRLWNAVVVMEVDAAGGPFEEAAEHHWLIRETDRVAIGDRIIGIAIFDEESGAWVYDEDLVIPLDI